MTFTRRRALAAMGAGTLASLAPTAAASGGDGTFGGAAPAEQSDDGFRVEWDTVRDSDYGWDCRAVTPTGDGGVAAVVNVVDGEQSALATRVVELTQSGETRNVGTIGSSNYEFARYWFWDIAPGISGGYVVAGYETEVSQFGTRQDYEPKLVHVRDDGTTNTLATMESSPTSVGTPEPLAVARDGEQYVVASGDLDGDGGAVLAGIGEEGNQRWKHSYDSNRTSNERPVQLGHTSDGLVLLAVRRPDDEPVRPELGRLADDGTVEERVRPSVEGDRHPTAFGERDGRFLVVGHTGADEEGETDPWGMELSGFSESPEWQGTVEGFGTGPTDAAGSKLFDGWAASGQTGDGRGRAVAGPDVSAPAFSHASDDSNVYEAVETVADGSTYVVGRSGSDAETQLVATKVSSALDEAEISASVEPSSPESGEPVSLSLDVGDYDRELLTPSWTVDGESIDAGYSGETSFENGGEYAVVATVSTHDGRSVDVERTVTVDGGGGGDGGLPGFGVLAAAAGLAGGAALWRRRDRDAE